MSLALYRKYRPSIFADVIGQEHVTTPLSNALESGKIHHFSPESIQSFDRSEQLYKMQVKGEIVCRSG